MSASPSRSSFRYRPDIDGLRAIAVIAVILYHAAPMVLPGGFVGVDIFFVISGFVITSVILRDQAQGNFSLADFWARRARRIIPPLLPVLAVTGIAALFLLMPRELAKFGNTMASQAIFGSNIHFYNNSGYFDAPAQSNLLLHTWSLSVEEQFYVVYPLLLLLITRLRQPPLMSFGGLLVLSLGVSMVMIDRDLVGAFYLPQSRAWELLLGALIAWYVQRQTVPRSTATWSHPVALLGLGMISASLWLINDDTRFPGAAALLPCGGAALLILSGTFAQTPITRLLSLRPMVRVGHISYSLYLWHWPILVIARHLGISALTTTQLLVCLTLTVVLSLLSYRYIETPIRKRRVLAHDRRLVSVVVSGLLIVAVGGKLANAAKGLPQRFPDTVARMYEDSQQKYPGCQPQRETDTGILCIHANPEAPPRFVLWGDSHAGALWPIIDEIATKRKINYLMLGCPPVTGVYLTDRATGFSDFPCAKKVRQLVKEADNIPLFVMVARWALYTTGHAPDALDARNRQAFYADRQHKARTAEESAELFRQHFSETVATLEKTSRVVIMRQVPEYSFWVPSRLVRAAMRGVPLDHIGQPLSRHRERQRLPDAIFDRLADEHVSIIDPAVILCADGQHCLAALQGHSLYRDDDHLSLFGARLLRPLLAPQLPSTEQAQ